MTTAPIHRTPWRVRVQPRWAVVRTLRDGTQDVLAAGDHWHRRGATYRAVDLRQRVITLAPQEIPTVDGMPVRLTPTLQLRVIDPITWLDAAQDAEAVVYLATQVAVREALALLTAEQLVGRGAQLPIAELTEQIAARAAQVGAEVLDVVIRDILLPPQVRQTAIELVTARQEAAIRLEQARAETASLRALANAAKLLDEHPALAQLRIVQAAGIGASINLTVGGRDSGTS